MIFPNTNPHILLPGDPNIEMIENLVSAQRAVDEISQYKEIGLKLQGSLWGMTGKVSLLALKVPPGKIFIFDMVKCPTALTGTNLAGVLESQEILKVRLIWEGTT